MSAPRPWRWAFTLRDSHPLSVDTWELRDGSGRVRAHVWRDRDGSGFTWHTYNEHGTGGENADARTLDDAQLFCIGCLVRQGWAPGGWRIEWQRKS